MIDKVELRKWWDIFVGDGNFTEVRILGRFQYSGYFKDFDNLARQLEPYTEMDDEQIYFVLNRIDESVYGRPQCEKFLKSPKVTTNDGDITSRRVVMCDFDPIRKSCTNSSAEEYQYALDKAKDVYYFLKEQGFEDCIICSSGNGIHLDLMVDLPNDEATTEIIKGFFKYMGGRFSDDKVEFDEKNYNLARLCKTYSTVSKKGANLPERPWRQSKILYVPQQLRPTPIEKFKALADLVPKEEPKPVPQRGYQRTYGAMGQPFDLVTWLTQHGINYRTKQSGGSTIYELEYCPWVDSHSDRKKWDSALFQDSDGKVTFNCSHSHCNGRTWHEFRTFYEPDAYQHKPMQYQQPMQYQRLPQAILPQPTVILPETAEKGKKWLSMKDIKKVNIDEMQGFVTGITELDRAIRKLYYGEVTILSGSNASGKSSLLNMLILNAVQQGVPNALYSGELPPKKLKMWIQMAAAGRDFLRRSKYGDSWYVPDHIGQKIDDWLDGRFFIFNDEGYSHRWEQLLADMTELAKAGVKFFTLDNLMSMSIDIFNGDNNKKQKELINQIVGFAKEFQAHVILVAHPRKATGFIRKTDIAGTSDLSNAVDNVFIVHRVNNDFKKLGGEFFGQAMISRYFGFGNVIECCKNRAWGIMDQLFGIYYEIESRRFKNTPTEQRQYGWRDDQAQQQNMFATPQATEQQPPSDMPFAAQSEENAPF